MTTIPCRKGGRFVRHVLRLHAAGLSDRAIARRLRCSHVTAARVLRRRGLASNVRPVARGPWTPAGLSLLSRAARDRIHLHGVEEVVACVRRFIPQRALAVRMGWSQAESLLQAQVLDLLCDRGPLTLAAICAALGRRPNWAGITVRAMRRRGLLARRGRAGKWVLYGLADGVTRAPAKRPRRCGGSEGGGP